MGTLNSGLGGGMLPLTSAEAETLHSPLLPANLYVSDASLLPRSLSLPPILTIMALAKSSKDEDDNLLEQYVKLCPNYLLLIDLQPLQS